MLLAACALSYFVAKGFADGALRSHEKTVCVHQWVVNKETEEAQKRKCKGDEIPKCTDEEWLESIAARGWPRSDDETLVLQDVGCSDKATDVISFGEARAGPSYFSWTSSFLNWLGISLTVAVAASLALYGIVRAIGWVIGGFAAS